MEAEYIPIKDFADKVGVTPSAVYQRLDKDLKPYLRVIEGKKTLDSQALELYEAQDNKTLELNKLLEDLKQIEQISRFYDPSTYVDDLKSQISDLKDQNNKLQDELFKEREHSRAQSNTIAELALRGQILLGVEQQKGKEQEQQAKKKKRFFSCLSRK